MVHHINKIKDKNHMTLSIDAEKAFGKVQHVFMIKTLHKVGIEGIYIKKIKAIYESPRANIILNRENLRAFSLHQARNRDVPSHHCYLT
uniref:Uncharacterized protein n=1 Tax=Ursus americanus TaxID=9643 RepID=A0A452S1C1_URSAM